MLVEDMQRLAIVNHSWDGDSKSFLYLTMYTPDSEECTYYPEILGSTERVMLSLDSCHACDCVKLLKSIVLLRFICVVYIHNLFFFIVG